MALDKIVKYEKRLCKVNGEYGYFHTWAHVSQPIEASPLDYSVEFTVSLNL